MKTKSLLLTIVLILTATIQACQFGQPDRTPGASSMPAASSLVSTHPATAYPITAVPPPTPTSTAALPGWSNIFADPASACLLDDYEGVTCLDSSGWHVYGTELFQQTSSTPPVWIAVCPDGRIYMDGGPGVITRPPGPAGAWSAIPGGNDHSGDHGYCGPAGDLWVVSIYGLAHFDGTTWTSYTTEQIFGHAEFTQDIANLAIAPDGTVWVTTINSLASFAGNAWQVRQTDRQFDSLAVDAQGNVWAANGALNSIQEFDGTTWTSFPEPNGGLLVLRIDPAGELWGVTHIGQIYRRNEKTLAWANQFPDLPLGIFRDLSFDRQGRAWAVGAYGIYVYDGLTWTVYHMFTADLFSEFNDHVVIGGDGPPLPSLVNKSPGGLRGRLVNPNNAFANIYVQLCLHSTSGYFSSTTPCEDDPYSLLTNVLSDGTFSFPEVKVGRYVLMIQVDPQTWAGSDYFSISAGQTLDLGDLAWPPNK